MMHAVSWQVEQSLKSWPVLKHRRLQRRATGNGAEKMKQRTLRFFLAFESVFLIALMRRLENAELYHTVHYIAEKK